MTVHATASSGARPGKALQVIRDGRLYRATHPTFEEYTIDRWEMSRTQADRLIRAWPLAERLAPIGVKIINESQVRELIPLANRHGEEAATTVYQAVVEADGGAGHRRCPQGCGEYSVS